MVKGKNRHATEACYNFHLNSICQNPGRDSIRSGWSRRFASKTMIFRLFDPALSSFFALIFVHNAENIVGKTPCSLYKQGAFVKFRTFAFLILNCEISDSMLNYNQSIFPEKLVAAIL